MPARAIGERDDQALDTRVAEITRPEFITGVLYPAVGETWSGTRPSLPWEPSLVQNRGTGRVTVRYRSADTAIYGKLYSDGLGAHSFHVQRQLRESGFGDDDPYQVARPLLYLTEPNLILVEAAPGVPLLSFLGQDTTEVRRYVRQAARWLVRLHRVPLRIGRAESSWDSLRLLKIVRRLTKAVARAPRERARLIDMIDALCDKGREAPEAPRCVQTHGRYHAEHVFVSGETTTLIDLDRSCPADPAKDLAEFVSMLRLRTFKQMGTTATADVPTLIFLDEYLSHLPRHGQTLAAHWGAYLLLNMFHYVKKFSPADESYPSMLRFYLGEFETALGGRMTQGA
jgi:hypothetical protein